MHGLSIHLSWYTPKLDVAFLIGNQPPLLQNENATYPSLYKSHGKEA
nr:MAG: hypothetical protein [Bacteriophage sp.]